MDKINPDLFERAFMLSRRLDGMPDFKVLFNPYTNMWKVEATHMKDGDVGRYKYDATDVNVALEYLIAHLERVVGI